jgi:hypothetical protein
MILPLKVWNTGEATLLRHGATKRPPIPSGYKKPA